MDIKGYGVFREVDGELVTVPSKAVQIDNIYYIFIRGTNGEWTTNSTGDKKLRTFNELMEYLNE